MRWRHALAPGRRALLLGCALIGLSGCALDFDADAIRADRPDASPFARALGGYLLTLAIAERERSDWPDALAYAARADAAFAGAPPPPLAPSARRLTEADAAVASAMLTAIEAAFKAGGKLIAPQDMAHAQAGYECWLEEVEEGHQPADIAACKAALDDAMGGLARLDRSALFVLLPQSDGRPSAITIDTGAGAAVVDRPNAAAFAVAGKAPMALGPVSSVEIQEVFAAAAAAKPPPVLRFILYFVTGTDDLTADSAVMLQDVLKSFANRPAPRAAVVGHTDRVGAADLNRKLALTRAEAIANALTAAGMPRDAVSIASNGEDAPLVPTADDVAEARNRRVEVLIF